MQFLKKHYEKIILSIVLLGLAVAAVWLSIAVREKRMELVDETKSLTEVPKKIMPPLDLGPFQASLAKVTNPPPINIYTQHLLFSPVKWLKKEDGSLIKVQTGNEVGAGAVTVTKVTPLNLIITLGNITGTAENPRYQFNIERQAAADKTARRPFSRYGGLTASNEVFTVKEVKGEPLNPIEIVLELKEGAEIAVVTKAQAFTKAVDYAVDLQYPPENLSFPGKRLGESISLAGESYNIVAITDKQIVLSAPNNKRIFVPINPVP